MTTPTSFTPKLYVFTDLPLSAAAKAYTHNGLIVIDGDGTLTAAQVAAQLQSATGRDVAGQTAHATTEQLYPAG